MSHYPNDRRYSEDHEWARLDGDVVVGVSAHAVEQLGDITLVTVDVSVGDVIEAGKAFGTIESVKTLSDILAPIAGKVTAINNELENAPELLNEDCYDKGWLIKLAPANPGDLDNLMDAAAYEGFVKRAAH